MCNLSRRSLDAAGQITSALPASPAGFGASTRRFAFVVRDSSMNLAKPSPILPGMIVLCIDLADTEHELQTGKIYLVRRTDGELTLRRAHVFKDRIDLRPQSTEDHPIIMAPRSHEPLSDVLVGLVYGKFRSFEYKQDHAITAI